MDLQAAKEALLKKGNKVKLPEWGGYWFATGPHDEDIRVFTKTGDVLDTPWFDKFKDRDDFEVTDGSLGYDWALNALKSGKCVARAGWNGKGMFAFQRPGDTLSKDFLPNVKSLPENAKTFMISLQRDVEFMPYFCLWSADGKVMNGWQANTLDAMATDWGLAENILPQ